MCDTFFSPAHVNLHGYAILAKNSDREPNEAQSIVRFPAHKRSEKRVQATFIVVDCPEQVHEVILSKPFHMWGAEMGVNEHGVAIGNEAVFTKMKLSRNNDGLTGMDLLRLALEQSISATEALHVIIQLLGKYGQDACGGYQDRGMYYSNSFLIADTQSAYVLETAGPFWAYKSVKTFYAISNLLSIGTDFDEIHPAAKAYAYQKSWMKRDVPFHFQEAFSEPIMTFLGRGAFRKQQCEIQLGTTQNPSFSVLDAFQILRSHRKKEHFEPCHGDMGNICLHAQGILTPSQTTGSMVVELREKAQSSVWLTGSSAPCLSVFKPFYFGTTTLEEAHFLPSTHQMDESYWWKWEKIHRAGLLNYALIHSLVQHFQMEKEKSWFDVDQQWANQDNLSEKEQLSQKALEDCLQLFKQIEELPKLSSMRGHWGYRWYWKWQNRKVNYERA